MSGLFSLAVRHLLHHRIRSGILLLALALTLSVPPVYRVLLQSAFSAWRQRGAEIPLVVGPRGSPIDLLLTALAFQPESRAGMTFGEFLDAKFQHPGAVVPLHVRHRVSGFSVVGTDPEYFRWRSLACRSGRFMALAGECVLGAEVAERLGKKPGDTMDSGREGLFGIQSAVPVRLQVAGVLWPTGGPDDSAVFTDLSTAWILDGLGHAHRPEERHGPQMPTGFYEVTEENRSWLHFHGEKNGYPLSAVLVRPVDEKSQALFLGRYLNIESPLQCLKAGAEMDRLVNRVLRIEAVLRPAGWLVMAGSLITAGLVFWLSMHLRRRERVTLEHLGASRGRIRLLMLAESLLILFAASLLAAAASGVAGFADAGWVLNLLK